MNYPGVSVVICTYNGKAFVKRLLDSIFSQDYPGRFEVICVDGGSSDGTLELLKQHNVKIHHNKKRFPEGRGMGKDQGVQIAKHELILIIDQDNKLVGKDCLKHLVLPLMEDREIFGVACRLYVEKSDNLTNRYLSYVGTDPFAAYRSLEGRVALKKIKLRDEGGYWSYCLHPEEQLCTGGNCFLCRKGLLEKIGGYSQDVEVISGFAELGITKFAIPKEARTHHLAVSGFGEFLMKKWKWGWHYAFENSQGRRASWYPSGKEYFMILGNLVFIPSLFQGVKFALQYRDAAWFLHPVALFCNTGIYCCVGFLRIFKRWCFPAAMAWARIGR